MMVLNQSTQEFNEKQQRALFPPKKLNTVPTHAREKQL